MILNLKLVNPIKLIEINNKKGGLTIQPTKSFNLRFKFLPKFGIGQNAVLTEVTPTPLVVKET